MQGFVQGADRQQTTLLPECLDDWVDESNSIRAVDVFVDALELRDLGFTKLVRRDTGVYENVTARNGDSRYMVSGKPETVPNIKKTVSD